MFLKYLNMKSWTQIKLKPVLFWGDSINFIVLLQKVQCGNYNTKTQK